MPWRRQGSGSGAGSLCAFHPRILESLPMTQNVISIDIPAELLAKLDKRYTFLLYDDCRNDQDEVNCRIEAMNALYIVRQGLHVVPIL